MPDKHDHNMPHEGDKAEGHHGFDMTAALLHHNMPYPAWEIFHGKPIIIFDRATYAAKYYKKLAKKPGFADKQATSADLAWAESTLVIPEGKTSSDFRYDSTKIPGADNLAKAMQVADDQAIISFPQALSFYNQQTFFGTVALLLLTLVFCVLFKRKPDQLKPQGRVQHFLESIVMYLRDEVVRPSISHGGDKWVPFIVTVFFMILTVNLFGLIPGTGTMSGNIGVTAAFASCILLCMLFFGMKEQGLKYWITLVPIHFSWPLSPVWVLLFIIEGLGLIIKPAALAIRLFANMFAGHTVLLVFISLGYIIISSKPDSEGLAIGLKGFGWVLNTVFYLMEVLVAFIQAYVFTLLAALFIGMSVHPEH